MAPLFPRSGPGESSSPMSQVVLRCYDFPSRLSGRLFVSLPGSTLPSSVRVSQLAPRSRKDGGCLPGRGHCSAGDPIAGLLSRGRERDLPGFQAVHPVPFPRSRTPAESTIPRLFVGLVDAAPTGTTANQRINHIGAIPRLAAGYPRRVWNSLRHSASAKEIEDRPIFSPSSYAAWVQPPIATVKS